MPELTAADGKRITDLEKNQAVTDLKLDNINQSILEIKNNHLLHINDKLAELSKTINDNNVSLVGLVNTKVGDVYAKLTDLKINDAKQEPTNSILNKVIEYVIVAVVAAGIAFLLKK